MCEIFGIKIHSLILAEAVQKIKELANLSQKSLVVTANPEILLQAYYDSRLKTKINRAAFVLADGIGIIIISRFIGQPITKSRVTGVDLVEELAKQSTTNKLTLFLIGKDEIILQKATQNLKSKYPDAKILGYGVGPIFSKNQTMPILDNVNQFLIKKVNNLSPDIVLVGFGSPKQDNWLDYYLPQLNCRVGIGVGGSFDYLSQTINRAPVMWRKLGFEWLYRLINEPIRLKRIIKAVVLFPLLAIFYHIKQNVLRRTS